MSLSQQPPRYHCHNLYRLLLVLIFTFCTSKYGTTIAFTSAAISAGSNRGGVTSVSPSLHTRSFTEGASMSRLTKTQHPAATSEVPTSLTTNDASSKGPVSVDDPSKVKKLI
jgi:hypothetical protein